MRTGPTAAAVCGGRMDDWCIDPALHSTQAVPKRKRCHSVKRGARRLHPILWQRQIQDLKEYLSEDLGIELPSGIQRKHPQSPPETGELQIILQKNAQQWSITILSTEHYRQCLEVSTNPITSPPRSATALTSTQKHIHITTSIQCKASCTELQAFGWFYHCSVRWTQE